MLKITTGKLRRLLVNQSIIDNNFKYHSPAGNQPAKYTAIRAKGKELAELINVEVPESREKSLAMTKLEEVVMWANAGIARNKEELCIKWSQPTEYSSSVKQTTINGSFSPEP